MFHSTAAEIPVKFQSHLQILIIDLEAFRQDLGKRIFKMAAGQSSRVYKMDQQPSTKTNVAY